MVNRIMVNMAKVNTMELAKETNLPTDEVEKVVSQIIADKNNHSRQPKAPAPEGGISLRAAERKYGVSNATLSRWTKKGLIPVLLRTRNELYLDEKALIGLLNLYKQNSGQGKWTIKQITNAS